MRDKTDFFAGSISTNLERNKAELRDAAVREDRFDAIKASGAVGAKVFEETSRGYRVILQRHSDSALAPNGRVFNAFVRGPDGRIREAAKLARIGPNLLNIVGTIAGQALLVEIKTELAALNSKLDDIVANQESETRGPIEALVTQLKLWDRESEAEQRSSLTTMSQTATERLGVVIEQLNHRLVSIESPNSPWMPANLDSNHQKVRASLHRAYRSIETFGLALRVFSEIQTLRHGSDYAAQALLEHCAKLNWQALERAEALALIVNYLQTKDVSSQPWRDAADAIRNARDCAASYLDPHRVISLPLD